MYLQSEGLKMVERPGSQIPSNNSRHWWACWVWEWGHWPDGGVQEEFLNLLNCSTGQIVYLEFSAFLLISSRRVIKSYVRRWWELGEQGSSGRGVIFKIYLFRFVPISLTWLPLRLPCISVVWIPFSLQWAWQSGNHSLIWTLRDSGVLSISKLRTRRQSQNS